MAICKFFMQGNCRYGNNCWNEHPSGGSAGYAYTAQRQLFGGGGGGGGGRGGRGGGGGGHHNVTFRDSFGSGGNQNPFKWSSNDNQKQQGQKQTTAQVSPNDVINTLISEIKDWEQNKMWPFSCIGFEKDCPCIPDFDDKSQEELRSEAYEANGSGNGQVYEHQVQKLATDFYNKRQMLKTPGLQLKQKLISLIEDYRIKKNSRTGSSYGGVSLFSSPTSGTSPFGSTTQQSTNAFGSPASNSPFGNTQNVFGQSQSPFGSTQTGSANIFGSAQTGGTSTFGTPQPATGGAFGTSHPSTPNPFGTAQTGSASTFGTPQAGSTGPFGTTQSGSVGLFGKPAPASTFGASPAVPSGAFGTTQQVSNQTSGFDSSSMFSSTPLSGAGSSFANSGFKSGAGFIATPSVNLFGATPGQDLFSSAGGASGEGMSSTPKLGQTSAGTGLFGKPAPPQQQQQLPHSAPMGQSSSVYTPLDKLTQEELSAFQAQTFTLGKIPTKPPPRELCF